MNIIARNKNKIKEAQLREMEGGERMHIKIHIFGRKRGEEGRRRMKPEARGTSANIEHTRAMAW